MSEGLHGKALVCMSEGDSDVFIMVRERDRNCARDSHVGVPDVDFSAFSCLNFGLPLILCCVYV